VSTALSHRSHSHLSHLECSRCGKRHAADLVQGLCDCGAPLLARYDLTAVADAVTRDDIAGREPTLWRYHELLPVRHADAVVSLGEGMTPLFGLPRLGAAYGLERLLVKDEGLLPTGSFKARGAAVGVSRAVELGVTGVAMPTNGNAGASWAAYAARAGIRSLIAMPRGAPDVTRRECLAAGAELYVVDGHIGVCGQMIASAVQRRRGFQQVSTLKEPYRLEGKKTMGIEIVEQLGWRAPDVIVYPTGGGVGLIGIYKALLELIVLGWIGPRLPRLVAVQSTGCAPVVQAVDAGATVCEPWADPVTIAFGITVPAPLGDFLILQAVRATGGTAVAVDDEEILHEVRRCAGLEGLFLCPEGAAAMAAVRQLRSSGWLDAAEEVVVLNTGSGLKYPETISQRAPVLKASDEIPG
jgi:threonine synthase